MLHVVRYPAAGLPQVIDADQRHRLRPDPRHPHADRRDDRGSRLREIQAGNIYVNRNIVGAVVGVQPFGGEGLSGTGPKAGGPLYLHRLVRSEAPPELHGDTVPVTFDALQALQAALPKLQELGAAQRSRLQTRIRLYQAASPLNVRMQLPGPTGEDNRLWFEPRGAVGCSAESLQQLLEQLAAAWATRQPRRRPRHRPRPPPRAHGRPSGHRVRAGSGRRGSSTPLLFAGAADDADALRRRLPAHGQMIVPLIWSRVDGSYDLHRLVVEKVVSVNTTAAGGNAALMSLEGE